MKQVFRFLGIKGSDNSSWLIEAAEHHHLTKVLRLKIGDVVEVTDGKGAWGAGTIEDISRHNTTVASKTDSTDPAPCEINVLLGALQPIPSMVELGVTSLNFFGQASVAKNRLKPSVVERWHRIALSACKQSKRSWFPSIDTFSSLNQVLTERKMEPGTKIVLNENASNPIMTKLGSKGAVTAVIGGEKGLDDKELLLLEKEGFVPVKFCDTILRARTAAVAVIALVSATRL